MTDKIELLVREIVATSIARRPEEISPKDRLREDLKIDGDDAIEVLCLIRDRLNVDFSAFKFQRHFADEPFIWIPSLLEFLDRLFRRSKQRFVPVTVADLTEAARRGFWVEEKAKADT